MGRKPDDWTYIRKRNEHFTEEEMLHIRKSFRAGVKARVLAREMQCSSRVIQLRYRQISGGDTTTPSQRAAAKRELPQRHYHSNFELGE